MIAIVGAGMTGLCLAHLLKKQGKEFVILEASPNAGGNIQTHFKQGYLLEGGPNSIRMNDQLYQVILDLDLEDALQYTNEKAKKRFVLYNGQPKELPASPLKLLFGGFFSFSELRRLWKERRVSVGENENESVDEFFRRRFGDKVADYMVSPFVSGIFAGDPASLLMSQAFPLVKEWERKYGSVLKGFRKGRTQSQHQGIFSFKKGLGEMVQALIGNLRPQLKLSSTLKAIRQEEKDWVLGFGSREFKADQVVLAMPAFQSAALLKSRYPSQAKALDEVYYPPMAVVHSAYARTAVGHPLDGFGMLNTQLEAAKTLGTIFNSSIFPGRCPKGQALVTTFIGGALHPEKALAPDSDLLRMVAEDHKSFLSTKNQPIFTQITRKAKAIPQFDQRILAAHAQIPKLESQNLFLAGNWTGGISVPSCLEKAHELCEKLI